MIFSLQCDISLLWWTVKLSSFHLQSLSHFFVYFYLQPPASHRQLTSFSGFYPVRYSTTSLFSCPRFCSIHQLLFIWLLPTFCSWVLEAASLLDAVTLKKAMPCEFKKWPYATETLYTNPPLRDEHSTVLHWNVAISFCKKYRSRILLTNQIPGSVHSDICRD